MPSHLHYVTYCFRGNVASQSFTLDKEQIKNSCYTVFFYQLYKYNVYSSQIFTNYKRTEMKVKYMYKHISFLLVLQALMLNCNFV